LAPGERSETGGKPDTSALVGLGCENVGKPASENNPTPKLNAPQKQYFFG